MSVVRRTALCCVAALAASMGLGLGASEHDPDTPSPRPFPLLTCPVSGDDLAAVGDAVRLVVDGREVRLCCEGCVEDFKADSERFWGRVDAQIVREQMMHYPLETCVVSGEPLEDDAINAVHDSRLVRLCCKGCRSDLADSPERFMRLLDEKIADALREDYPLDECIVSEMELGSMGEPFEIVFANRLVQFCCKGCVGDFHDRPHEHMARLDEAYAGAQREEYPLDECVVSGTKLGAMGEPYEMVAGTQLVRFCCKGCVDDFKADPARYLAQFDRDD
jgi:hypothetical protein